MCVCVAVIALAGVLMYIHIDCVSADGPDILASDVGFVLVV